MICAIRVEEIEDLLMQEICYVDKLVDELAKEKEMEKILRELCYKELIHVLFIAIG